MVIFHSYVSLPEGRATAHRLVSTVATAHAFLVVSSGVGSNFRGLKAGTWC